MSSGPKGWWRHETHVRKLAQGEAEREERERRRAVREALYCVLVVLGVAAALIAMSVMPGCSYIATVPPAIADGVATVESNTRTLDGDYRRILDGVARGEVVPIGDELEHDRALMDANERLLLELKTWVQNHTEGK